MSTAVALKEIVLERVRALKDGDDNPLFAARSVFEGLHPSSRMSRPVVQLVELNRKPDEDYPTIRNMTLALRIYETDKRDDKGVAAKERLDRLQEYVEADLELLSVQVVPVRNIQTNSGELQEGQNAWMVWRQLTFDTTVLSDGEGEKPIYQGGYITVDGDPIGEVLDLRTRIREKDGRLEAEDQGHSIAVAVEAGYDVEVRCKLRGFKPEAQTLFRAISNAKVGFRKRRRLVEFHPRHPHELEPPDDAVGWTLRNAVSYLEADLRWSPAFELLQEVLFVAASEDNLEFFEMFRWEDKPAPPSPPEE